MTVDAFRDSPAEPAELDVPLRALWWAGKGDWEQAHALVQSQEGTPASDLVHAHLHRQEGDLPNAQYWYRRAGRSMPSLSLQAEWDALVAELLDP